MTSSNETERDLRVGDRVSWTYEGKTVLGTVTRRPFPGDQGRDRCGVTWDDGFENDPRVDLIVRVEAPDAS